MVITWLEEQSINYGINIDFGVVINSSACNVLIVLKIILFSALSLVSEKSFCHVLLR